MEGEIKKKIVNICDDIKEVDHALQSVVHWNNDRDRDNITTFPWLFIEQKRSTHVKEVIGKNNFPTRFSSNIKNILTKKGKLGGVKNHDFHTLIKVIILCIYILYIGEISC